MGEKEKVTKERKYKRRKKERRKNRERVRFLSRGMGKKEETEGEEKHY